MSVIGVRREKAALSSGCTPNPDIGSRFQAAELEAARHLSAGAAVVSGMLADVSHLLRLTEHDRKEANIPGRA
jgi:hypothetical protein